MPYINDIFYDLKVPEQKRTYMTLYQRLWRERNPERHKIIVRRRNDKVREDPELRQKRNEYQKQFTAKPEVKARNADRAKDRYHNNEEYRKKKQEKARQRYHDDPEYRQRLLQRRTSE